MLIGMKYNFKVIKLMQNTVNFFQFNSFKWKNTRIMRLCWRDIAPNLIRLETDFRASYSLKFLNVIKVAKRNKLYVTIFIFLLNLINFERKLKILQTSEIIFRKLLHPLTSKIEQVIILIIT
jgi:hypothetical protein